MASTAGAGALQPGTATVVSTDNVPMLLNYQGYLTDTAGNQISGMVTLGFAVYADSLTGNPLWSQTQNIQVEKGVFNVKLVLQPGDTGIFSGGQRRWMGLTVNGFTLSPRTEITSMAYGIHSLQADNADALDGRHATEFIWNGTNRQTSSNFYVSGTGKADVQLAAFATGQSNTPAIVGSVTGTNTGVYGQSPSSIGVFGQSTSGTAVVGQCTTGIGVSGSSRSGAGVMARSATDNSFASWGINSATHGTAIVGAGCNDTAYYLTCGTGGAFTARHIGLFCYAHDTTGTGIATMGNRISDTVFTLAGGSGGSFNGSQFGVYGLARNLTGDRCGGFFRTFSNGQDTTYSYVAYNYGGTTYKILGNGLVSTVMNTREGKRILFAPESPEPFFEDFGTGRLVAGHCRVDLDPVFSDCIEAGASHPLKVFVTLNDDCNGVYVKSDATGFDVYELQGGKSSAAFGYRVVAHRKGDADLRLPPAPTLPQDRAVKAGAETAPDSPAR